jgi:hypothetical protein
MRIPSLRLVTQAQTITKQQQMLPTAGQKLQGLASLDRIRVMLQQMGHLFIAALDLSL